MNHSDRRDYVLRSQVEKIELAAAEASKLGLEFAVLVCDLSDPLGTKMAMLFAGPGGSERVEKAMSDHELTPETPVLIKAVGLGVIGGLFALDPANAPAWKQFMDTDLPGCFRIVVVGDGGISLSAHRLPS